MPGSPRTLILVDLDNLAQHVGVAAVLPSARPGADASWLHAVPGHDVPTRESSAPRCVVAIALNLSTAMNGPDSMFDHLRKLARHLAHHVATADTCGIEIALVLDVPQAADAMLERLLLEAPRVGHDGEFHEVVVCTKDRGLVGSIRERLKDWRAADRRDACHCRWTSTTLLRRVRPRDPAPPRCAPAVVEDAARNVEIHQAELVAWASRQAVDSIELDLQQLAVRCRSHVGVLSQLGPTVHSLRGLARLADYADARAAPVGVCAAIDGLELRAHPAATGRYESATASKLGPGALRLEAPHGTVASRLPLVVARSARSIAVSDAAVHMTNTMASISRGAPLGADDDAVDFERRGKALLVRVRAPWGKPPSVWWTEGMAATSHNQCAQLGDLATGVLAEIACRCAVVGGHSKPRVVLRAPATNAPIHVEHRVERERLGLGLADGRRFAVLAPSAGLPPGHYTCTTIQTIDDEDFARSHPGLGAHLDTLRELPIVVPVRASAPVSGPGSAGVVPSTRRTP